ncbi:MAG TPA: trypsin-like serine protease, partial [Solirubrobacteraceae bacterium]|nr:trypsin-like serine protease [Solirubrobacteraceae bacterium]
PTPAIDGNHTIAPIPLASTLPPAGSTLTVSGWGYDKELAGGARPSEEVGFQRYLQSTQIPLVAQGACEQDYRAVGRTAPPGTVCAGSAGPGPCYSDSGGPLFTGPPTPPGTYALLGVVDTGYGCAQASYPVIFQSVLDANNLRFVSSNPPQAPLEQAPPTISGDPEPGHALACNPGSWSANPTYTYRFYSDQTTPSTPDAHTALTSLSPTDTYTLSAADAGRRILCEARATNAGGYNFDISQDLTVAGTLYTRSAGEPPPAAAPTLTIVSKNCQHRRCVVNVRASQGTGAAAVVAVKATLGFKRWRPCRRRRSGRSRCLRTFERRLRAQAIPAAHFVIRTGRLSAGRYELSLLAIDRAGVRQTRATVVGLTVGRTGRGHR